MSHTFSSFLEAPLSQAISGLGFEKPTPIQYQCIPEIIKGKDVIASAKTGSGKTAAFALPIIQKLSIDPYGVYALVLTPTRELAFQIADQFKAFGAFLHLKVSVVVGGMDMIQQALELSKRPHVIVATPGRLVDHIESSSNVIHLKRVKFLVLDEADRMLDENFANDLTTILAELPKDRQTLLFSATLTPEITAMSFKPDRKPFIYRENESFETVQKLDQQYLFVPYMVRDAYLAHLLLDQYKVDKVTMEQEDNALTATSIIIFTLKCKTCERVRVMLKELGIRSTALHSKMNQNERLGSLAKFKAGVVPILVTTDVGSRGLDIPTVKVVINYELPADPTDYIHRIGRTARAGRGGLALSLVTEKDIDILTNIETKIDKKLSEYKVDEKPVLQLLNEVSLARRTANLYLVDMKFGEKDRINREKRKRE